VIARNFDYLELVQPYHIVRENRPAEGLRSFEFTVAPLAGAMDGVNEAGLCIVYDYAFTLDQPAEPAPSISMLVSGALQRCLTVAEAADYLATRSRWGGALLMMADGTGDIASLEISSTRCELRRPAAGQDYCLHTNRFQTAAMRSVEAPEDAVLDSHAPVAMRGKRLHESAERRAQRLEELMQKGGAFGLDKLNRVMADHGSEGKPSAYTPCVHSNYWNTTTCVQLLPRSRTLRIAFTRPCEARFHEFTL
jgi:predicted choloylglycine hydrolase